MFRKYFIFILFTFLIAESNPNISDRYYISNGKIDASISSDSNKDNLVLIQIDAINDSLFSLADAAVSNLDLLAGPSSYHRIVTINQYERLSATLSEEYLYILDNNYNPPNSRDYWVHTIHGDNYYGSSGEVGNTCMCLDASGCVVVGFNDSWYDPFDYYGEAWWNFQPPQFDNVTEVRVYVQGAQCDNLPIWSETDVSIRDNNCSSNGNFQATLSLDYTLNGPYVIPTDQLGNIWCEGNLQPIVGSEDNYSVDFIRIEFYYSCDFPNEVSNLEASNEDFCDYVDLNWISEISASSGYLLYKDGQLVNQFSQETNQYLDYQAEPGVQHQYCIYSVNDCGESESTCSNGKRKSEPESVDNIYASDGNSSEFIFIQWDIVPGDILYKLYRDGVQLTLMSNNQDLYYEDQFVESQQIYEYCIEAVNDCGSSIWSCDDGFLGIGEVGDVNLDSTLDILDVILVLNFILEIEFPNDDQLWLSDINADSILNILDIIALVNIILN